MTDLRQAAQQALEALEAKGDAWIVLERKAITALKAALEQQAEPVSQAVIAGALFDFMGWLTSRKERLVLSIVDDASPAADAIKVFAKMRGLSLDDARVQDWQNYTAPPQRKELSEIQILDMMPSQIPSEYDGPLMEFARAIEAKLKERNK